MSFRLCWAFCSHQVSSSCCTCAGTCFGSQERLEHWDCSQNLCFSFPFPSCSKTEGVYNARPGLGRPTGTEQEWWQELPPVGSSPSSLPLVHRAKRGEPRGHLALRGDPHGTRHTRVTGCGEDFSPLLHLLHLFPLYRSLYPFELQKYSRVPLEFTVLRINLSVLRFVA